ncbi:MAG: uroporphyrinogen decarboxylase, partial [Planctomycetes bacterium]|nr:uroporphyrinogen decarboxylase [Planctomycetota bacterium]
MTDEQWNILLRVLEGDLIDSPPVGFLVDGPWFSGLCHVRLMDYLSDSRLWLEANLRAHARFPDVLWLPGFWAEFGMISNPPSFGAKCIWPEEGFPTCESILDDYDDILHLQLPNVRTDGLLPLMTARVQQNLPVIEAAGHRIRFAAAHGPLTIGSYLLGHTPFFLGMRTEADAIHRLLQITTQFVIDWLRLQKELFPSIDGILILEDMMGFVGPQDFREFALPYIAEIFASQDVSVRFLHNDAAGLITAQHLTDMGVNLFNFSYEHSIAEIRNLAGERVTLLGNVPPRDVLAQGTHDDIRRHVNHIVQAMPDRRRLIISGGGFTPPQFDEGRIRAAA